MRPFDRVAMTAWVPGTVAPGTYFLLACVDQSNLVKESDEGNNSRG